MTRLSFIIRHDIEDAFMRPYRRQIALRKYPVPNWALRLITPSRRWQRAGGFRQPEGRSKPWAPTRPVLACKGIIKEPFAVINADDYYGKGGFVQLHSLFCRLPRRRSLGESEHGRLLC